MVSWGLWCKDAKSVKWVLGIISIMILTEMPLYWGVANIRIELVFDN